MIGWLRAKRFAVSQGRIEPLCGFVAAVFSRFRRVSEELFEAIVLEITHYTDFETGALLDRLAMPFAGHDVEVPAFRFGPASTRYAVRLDEGEEFEPEPDSTQGAFSPAASILMTKSIHGFTREACTCVTRSMAGSSRRMAICPVCSTRNRRSGPRL